MLPVRPPVFRPAEGARPVRAPARWLLPLVALAVVWHGADDGLRGLAMVQRLTGMATIAAVTWLLMRAVTTVPGGTRGGRRAGEITEGGDEAVVRIVDFLAEAKVI